MFKRAHYRTEIHSEAYLGTRTTCSHHVAVVYEEYSQGRRNEPPVPVKVEYYATVHRFFKVLCGKKTFRLAFVTAYPLVQKRSIGVPFVNMRLPFAKGRVVQVSCINRKVILAPGHPTAVLRVPEPYVRLP